METSSNLQYNTEFKQYSIVHPSPDCAPQDNAEAQHDSSVNPLPEPSLRLPARISSQLRMGFRGTPLPASAASLSKPPIYRPPVLDGKIQWDGSWRDGWEPKWGTIEPQLDQIAQVAAPFLQFCGIDPENFTVAPFHQGMWNKLYLIRSQNHETGVTAVRIFRIPLPVNPWFKMQSEVATMEYVRENTSIPVPKLYVFESSMENALGFEWMIMEMIDGIAFRVAQHSLSQTAQERVYKTIADWVNDLSLLRFDHIGSLYREWDPDAKNYLNFSLGPVAADCFLGPWRTERDVFRGPFRNEAEFLRAVTELNLADVLDPRHRRLAELVWAKAAGYEFVSDEFSEGEIIEEGDSDSQKTSSEVPKIETPTTVYTSAEAFDPSGVQKACFSVLNVLPLMDERLVKAQVPRTYVLHHFDISKENVLVNRDGEAIALLDWENMVTESLSQVYLWPSLIDPTKYDPPEPWPQNKPMRGWYLDALEKYNNSLAVPAFLQRLRELNSPWPQAEGPEQKFETDFEEDLSHLGDLAKGIYSRWGEIGICHKVREKYSELFLPVPCPWPGGTHEWKSLGSGTIIREQINGKQQLATGSE